MKKYIISIIMLLLLSIPCLADDNKQQYKVEFTITYDAIDADKVAEILKKVIIENKNSSKITHIIIPILSINNWDYYHQQWWGGDYVPSDILVNDGTGKLELNTNE